MEKLGDIIRGLRGKESLRDASKRIGISHTYLDTIEKGYDKRSGSPVNPTPDTLKLLSKAYNYPYQELMEVAGYIDEEKIDRDKKSAIIEKIKSEFPDAELMFNDLAGFSADDMQDVYDYIKFKKSQIDEK